MADRLNNHDAMPSLEDIDPIGMLLSTLNISQGTKESQQPSNSEANGTWGTCAWEIDADGVLTVHPGKGGEASNTFGVTSYWIRWQDAVRSVVFVEEGGKRVVAPQNCTGLFSGMTNLEALDLSEGDFSSVTSMSALLNFCTSLKSVNLSGINASKVTDVKAMFNGCSSLESVDMSNLDISSVKDLSAMFNCADTYLNPSSLVKVDLSGLVAPSVTTMSAMFRSCDSLETMNLSGIKVSQLEDMSAMFYDCRSLRNVDFSLLDTSSVKNMEALFYGCSSLTSLDLSGFDTSNVTSMGSMFKWCMSLKELDASGFDTSNVKAERLNYMFKGCASLQRVVLGAKTKPFGDLPSSEVSGRTEWLSNSECTWFTAHEIGESRLGIADTYTKG